MYACVFMYMCLYIYIHICICDVYTHMYINITCKRKDIVYAQAENVMMLFSKISYIRVAMKNTY